MPEALSFISISTFLLPCSNQLSVFSLTLCIVCSMILSLCIWPSSKVVMLRTANPPPSVRFRPRPPIFLFALMLLAFTSSQSQAGMYAADDIPQDLGTPLLNAIERNDDTLIDRLLLQKQSVNQPGIFGITPLMRAVYREHYAFTKKLLLNGANVNASDEGGATPLHYAVRTQDSGIIVLLVENGANANIKDKNGISPIQLASRLRDERIKQILQPTPKIAMHDAPVSPADTRAAKPRHKEEPASAPPKREVGYLEQTKKKPKEKSDLMVGEAQIVKEPMDSMVHTQRQIVEDESLDAQDTYQIRIDGFAEVEHVIEFWDGIKEDPAFVSKHVIVNLGEDDRAHAMLVGMYSSLPHTHEDCLAVHQRDPRLGCTIVCHRNQYKPSSSVPGSRH